MLEFVTVSPASLDAEALPSGQRPPTCPVAVLRAARLAVDESARGLGLGKALLRFCIELAENMMDELGCVGFLVDAKRDPVAFYEGYGFLYLAVVEGAAPQKPEPTSMFLGLGSVPRPKYYP